MKTNKLIEDLTQGPGYIVTQVDDIAAFSKIADGLIARANETLDKTVSDLEELRDISTTLDNKTVNKLMVRLLNFPSAARLMLDAHRATIRTLCEGAVFLQRRANIIFNIPGEGKRHQWPHYEIMSGISPFNFVLWAPLHDLDDAGGMFYLGNQESKSYLDAEIDRGLVNSPWMFERVSHHLPIKMKFGEVLIFNPFIIHGNSQFQSNRARIACSVRIQPSNLPLMQRTLDFYEYTEV